MGTSASSIESSVAKTTQNINPDDFSTRLNESDAALIYNIPSDIGLIDAFFKEGTESRNALERILRRGEAMLYWGVVSCSDYTEFEGLLESEESQGAILEVNYDDEDQEAIIERDGNGQIHKLILPYNIYTLFNYKRRATIVKAFLAHDIPISADVVESIKTVIGNVSQSKITGLAEEPGTVLENGFIQQVVEYFGMDYAVAISRWGMSGAPELTYKANALWLMRFAIDYPAFRNIPGEIANGIVHVYDFARYKPETIIRMYFDMQDTKRKDDEPLSPERPYVIYIMPTGDYDYPEYSNGEVDTNMLPTFYGDSKILEKLQRQLAELNVRLFITECSPDNIQWTHYNLRRMYGMSCNGLLAAHGSPYNIMLARHMQFNVIASSKFADKETGRILAHCYTPDAGFILLSCESFEVARELSKQGVFVTGPTRDITDKEFTVYLDDEGIPKLKVVYYYKERGASERIVIPSKTYFNGEEVKIED